MKKILVIIFALGVMVPATAQAENWYVTADAGVAILQDSTWTDSTVPGISLETEFEPGFLMDAGVGYDFGAIRTEAAIHFQRNNLDNIEGFDAGGDFTNTAVMFNGYYEFKTGFVFEPFITGGVGWAKVEANDISVMGIPVGDEDDTVFAWQVGAGAGFAL
jgi:opacity protein-like surface antigen